MTHESAPLQFADDVAAMKDFIRTILHKEIEGFRERWGVGPRAIEIGFVETTQFGDKVERWEPTDVTIEFRF